MDEYMFYCPSFNNHILFIVLIMLLLDLKISNVPETKLKLFHAWINPEFSLA